MRRGAQVTLLAAGLGLAACVTREPLPSAAELLADATASLARGEVEAAAEFVHRARRVEPGDVAAAQWSAVIAELLWKDDLAIAEQWQALRNARGAGLDQAALSEIQGRLGDLMFAAGRWGEATIWLQAGAVGEDAERRLAYASITRLLPFVRQQSGPFLTEQQLLPGDSPEFACGVAGRQRSLAIDTGTSMTTLSKGFAQELAAHSLQPAGFAVDGAGRKLQVEVGVLEQFAVGDVGIGSLPALVVADEALRLRDLQGGPARVPRGVLGLDLLAAFRLTLDPERASVVLELPTGLAESESVQCVRAEGRCLAPAVVEGVRLWFVLDTGASHSSLTQEGVAALPGGDARAVPAFRRVHTVGGNLIAVREVRDLVLRSSSARFQGITLPVVPRHASGLFPVHGVLGIDLLSRCRVTLDHGRAQLTAVR
ncbi:MAG: aspartyl protease family protein [Planctomycetes bacterium]|nr:aspartyl protease family protein [Planctomycetota bacterium]MCB9884698.1 aspartyl protease family protein [Planctomycetota bacterium]